MRFIPLVAFLSVTFPLVNQAALVVDLNGGAAAQSTTFVYDNLATTPTFDGGALDGSTSLSENSIAGASGSFTITWEATQASGSADASSWVFGDADAAIDPGGLSPGWGITSEGQSGGANQLGWNDGEAFLLTFDLSGLSLAPGYSLVFSARANASDESFRIYKRTSGGVGVVAAEVTAGAQVYSAAVAVDGLLQFAITDAGWDGGGANRINSIRIDSVFNDPGPSTSLETLLTENPGNPGSAILVWQVFANGANSSVENGSSGVPTTGELSNAAGNFEFVWRAERDFDPSDFTGNLASHGGNKWAYRAANDDLGPIALSNTDSSNLQDSEAIVMSFDLTDLDLDPGYVLRLDSVTILNSRGNPGTRDAGARFSFFDENRGTITQITGFDPGQIAVVSDVSLIKQTLNQIVRPGDEVALWKSRSGGQIRLGGFEFSVVPEPPAPTANSDSVIMHPGNKVSVPVLANDANLFELSRIEITSDPSAGVASIVDNKILYEHLVGSPAGDSLTYRLVDLDERISNTGTLDIIFSDEVRIPNTTLNIPLLPPSDGLAVENAFPGISFSAPIDIASPPGETDRLFVVERGFSFGGTSIYGTIKMVSDLSGTPTESIFLDLSEVLDSRGNEEASVNGENGLLSLAFHPDYASNGYLYVFYSVEIDNDLHQRVSRFSVNPGGNDVDPDSEQVLLQQLDDFSNHNGGDIEFGPDGYLYISVGDEGSQNDGGDNSQRIDKDFFSGILRIDVDQLPGNLEPNNHPSVVRDGNGDAFYSIPQDNPWVGATSFNSQSVNPSDVITEFYAVGMRNPWRIHFDPQNGDFYVADVGQVTREEVNIVRKGGNYGWAFFEGTLDGEKIGLAPPGFVQDEPFYDYGHGEGPFEGSSVTGGVVYYGDKLESLYGKYVFGDYVSGNVWALDRGTGEAERILGVPNIPAFGYDPSNGDVLMAGITTGQILRIVAGPPSDDFPETLSETGVFADVTDLSPNPGVLFYQPNLKFWSDHADKERWFVIPNLVDTIDFSMDDPWGYPTGMVWIKHFDIEMERGNPATKKRLETRLFVKTDEGAFGVSYRWNDEETEAYLVPSAGESFDLAINDGGDMIIQNWQIPSRANCITCHQPSAGHALSFNTRQLNQDHPVGDFAGNQIATLRDAGYLSGAPSDVDGLPRHLRPDEIDYSLEARVRSYFAVNCSYCHQEGGGTSGAFDVRPELSLEMTGLINGDVNNDGGDSSNKLIVPGDSSRSVLWHRMGASNGFSRMPPLASSELDVEAINLVQDWIDNELSQTYQTYDSWRQFYFGSPSSPEGEPDFDADGDGSSNQKEWLTRTDPTDEQDFWLPSYSVESGDSITLDFDRVLNRVTEVLVSDDLEEWRTLEDPANHGFPSGHSNSESIEIPIDGDSQFYRFRIE